VSIRFPYQYKRVDYGQILDPQVLIPILTTKGWSASWFLLDSGADVTSLPLRLAKYLKTELVKERPVEVSGVGKGSVRGYPSKISIKINDEILPIRCYFIENLEIISLLGRLDVFDKYDICFESSKKEVTFKRLG